MFKLEKEGQVVEVSTLVQASAFTNSGWNLVENLQQEFTVNGDTEESEVTSGDKDEKEPTKRGRKPSGK